MEKKTLKKWEKTKKKQKFSFVFHGRKTNVMLHEHKFYVLKTNVMLHEHKFYVLWTNQ